MSEQPQEPVAPVVARRIEAIVASAERAANEFRRQVETASREQAEKVREAAEADARRIRHEAATRAAEYLADSRRIVDEFAAERIARIATLTDRLIEQTEQVQRRFAHSEGVRRQIYDLIATLGDAAEAIAREAQTADPGLPRRPDAGLESVPPAEAAAQPAEDPVAAAPEGSEPGSPPPEAPVPTGAEGHAPAPPEDEPPPGEELRSEATGGDSPDEPPAPADEGDP